MEDLSYKKFSLNTHKKNWALNKQNVCQFELTFGCALHCRHCYTDCYNKPRYLANELKTKEIISILHKAYQAGVLWMCFTGGDPLTRKDFEEIYYYAKKKGFIVIIFTSGFSMDRQKAGYLKRSPPFVIEITLNAVAKDRFEKISQVKNSFEKTLAGIEMILGAGLPLKIKTQVTTDNFSELARIKKFVKKNFSLNITPSFIIDPRLNGDLAPCALRVKVKDLSKRNSKNKPLSQDCRLEGKALAGSALFHCAIASKDGFIVDPYGNTFPCAHIRKPSYNLIKLDIQSSLKKVFGWINKRNEFNSNSRCRACDLRDSCYWCPGKALLENKDMEKPIKYYCDLARVLKRRL